jgi:hypothetical protein
MSNMKRVFESVFVERFHAAGGRTPPPYGLNLVTATGGLHDRLMSWALDPSPPSTR